MNRGLFQWAFIISVLASTNTCREGRDPILALLTRLEAEAEKRDAAAIVSHLAPDFRGPDGLNRTGAETSLRRYFAAYQTVRIETYDVVVERAEASAVLRFRVDFVGEARKLGGLSALLPPSAMYRFELLLVPSGDDWIVAAAIWEELTSSPSPAA